MKKLILMSLICASQLLSAKTINEKKILEDFERELEAAIYLVEKNELNFIKENVVNELISNPINNYKISVYLKKYIKNEGIRNKVIRIVDENMKKFFTLSEESYIRTIVFAIIGIESSYNEKAVGDLNTNSPAYGPMQVRLSTAKYMNKKIPQFQKYKNKSDKWLINYLSSYKGGIEYGMGYLFFKKHYNKYEEKHKKDIFFTMVSLYNGGLYNNKYVNKVFKEISKIEIGM